MTPPVNARIRLVGLVKAPDLNHQQGSVVAPARGDGRVPVRLDSGREIAVKVANLEVLEAPGGDELHSGKPFQKCATLPQEPDLSMFDPDAPGWVMGCTEQWVWVLSAYESHGSESNRFVLLGRSRFEGEQPTAKDVTGALMEAMLGPRFNTNSSSGPRRPWKVELDHSLAHVIRGVRTDLVGMGVEQVEAIPPDEADAWFDSWYRCEVGLPITDELWLDMIEPARRHPMQPHVQPTQDAAASASQDAAARAYADAHPSPTTQQALRLPSRQGQWCVAVHAGTLYVFEPPAHAAPKLLLQCPVEVQGAGRQPSVDTVVGRLCMAMVEQGWRPEMLAVGQPSVASLMNVRPLEDALERLIEDGVMLAAQGNLEEMVAQAKTGGDWPPLARLDAIWVGARVTLVGLAARPELNGREGVVDGRSGAERWVVQLRTAEGLRDGEPKLLKPANLHVSEPEPPASSRQGRCLEISPAPLLAARDAIPVRLAREPLPVLGDGNVEAQEASILKSSRGWRQVRGLKAYTKAGAYPDLYCYFDSADTVSPVNNFAMRAFTAYTQDIGGLPAEGIRGDVVVVRAEPPSSFVDFDGIGGSGLPSGFTPSNGEFIPEIGIEEMRDTLLFYVAKDAEAVARERDMKRTMGPGMDLDGAGPVDLGHFTMP